MTGFCFNSCGLLKIALSLSELLCFFFWGLFWIFWGFCGFYLDRCGRSRLLWRFNRVFLIKWLKGCFIFLPTWLFPIIPIFLLYFTVLAHFLLPEPIFYAQIYHCVKSVQIRSFFSSVFLCKRIFPFPFPNMGKKRAS